MSGDFWHILQAFVLLVFCLLLIAADVYQWKKQKSRPGANAAASKLPGTDAQSKVPATVAESRLEFFTEGFSSYDLEQLRHPPDETPPVQRMLYEILATAIDAGAWSVIFEPFTEVARMRLHRGQGWKVLSTYSSTMHLELTAAAAAFFNIDLEPRGQLPLDGLVIVRLPGDDWLEVVISTMMGIRGQILRIGFRARERSFDLDLDQLGFMPKDLEKFKRAVDAQSGLMVVAGPIHAGKSIVCYSSLMRRLLRGDVVATVERPCKFLLKGAHQVRIKCSDDYEKGMREAMQHDPRVVMLQEVTSGGEIRVVVDTARTGRLVVIGMHIHNAVSVVNALLRRHSFHMTAPGVWKGDPPIPAAHVAEALTLVCAARQVRKICPACREKISTPAAAIVRAGLDIQTQRAVTTFRGRGCDRCWGTGFRGQTGVYEVLAVSPGMRKLIAADTLWQEMDKSTEFSEVYIAHCQAWLQVLAARAHEEGMVSMRELALQKALAGITSVQEAIFQTPEPYFRKKE